MQDTVSGFLAIYADHPTGCYNSEEIVLVACSDCLPVKPHSNCTTHVTTLTQHSHCCWQQNTLDGYNAKQQLHRPQSQQHHIDQKLCCTNAVSNTTEWHITTVTAGGDAE